MNRLRQYLPLLTLCLSLAGCGDGDDDTSAQPGGAIDGGISTPTGNAGIDAGTGATSGSAPSLFIVHSAVQGTDGNRLNYFSAVTDLAKPEKIDYGKSIELSGRPRLYAAPKLGFFAIADAETLSITRYEVGADGSFRPGAKLSLQQHGVSALEPQGVHFVSATKAYYKDSKQAQVLVFNPSTMTIDRAIPLPRELLIPDHNVSVSRWVARDGEAYFAVGATIKDYSRTLPGTTLVRIDTATDALTLTRETRCRGLSYVANVADTLYFFSDVMNGFGHAVYPNEGGQPDCTLRILPGQQVFDPSYVGSMQAALGGQIGTIVAATESGEAWAQVIDPAVMPKTPGTTYNQWYDKGWRWVHLTLPALSNPTEAGLAAGAYTAQTVTVGSSFYVSQASVDYGVTALVELGASGPKPGVSFNGFPLDVARVR
ncbi:MAG: MxcI [Polyangiales bacterium]